MHRSALHPVRLWLGALALAGVCAGQTLKRGPGVWSTTGDSFLVAFESSRPAVGAVEWGTTRWLGRRVGGKRTRDHAIRVTGLRPGGVYHYRVLLDGKPASPIHRTRTFGEDHVKFFVMGDLGTGTVEQYRVAWLVRHRPFDLGLLVGDLVYINGEPKEIDPHFVWPYAEVVPRVPLFPVLGNHDVKYRDGEAVLDAYHVPTGSSGTERWFSFDAGPAHFVGLDSTRVGDRAQTAWLRKDLAAARARGARWLFVQLHDPAYSSGVHGRDRKVFSKWCPIFEEFEVDMVFCGDDHHYERSKVMRDFHPKKRGVTYFVVGTGGRYLRKVHGRQKYSAFVAVRHGVLQVEVHGDVARTSFLDASPSSFGDELDVRTFVKGPRRGWLRATAIHPAPGDTYTGVLEAPPDAHYALYVSLWPGYLPAPSLNGVYHLAVGQDELLAVGLKGHGGSIPFRVELPDWKVLGGLDLLIQGVTLRGSSTLELTNLLPATIR